MITLFAKKDAFPVQDFQIIGFVIQDAVIGLVGPLEVALFCIDGSEQQQGFPVRRLLLEDVSDAGLGLFPGTLARMNAGKDQL